MAEAIAVKVDSVESEISYVVCWRPEGCCHWHAWCGLQQKCMLVA